jgi:predicted lipid-binding transport protein (Tim44 family)
MARHHEINMIANLTIQRVALVGVHYTVQPDQRSFTALITAKARDYYVDDRTSQFLRGDAAPEAFQEFWTFQRQGQSWLLRQIEQTRESGVLKEENVAETLTGAQLQAVYGVAAVVSGPAGPNRDRSVATKATRVQQLLDSLVKRDPLWNRQEMILRVRKVFMDVMLAQESGQASSALEDETFPQMAAALQERQQRRQSQGVIVEYRNLCLRNVELILIRNKVDVSQDEFTARVSAHAQVIKWQNSAVLEQQPYVTPFVAYWTFGRMDNQWRLKEILPEAGGQGLVTQDNVDETHVA